jgi:hypothetical protein
MERHPDAAATPLVLSGDGDAIPNVGNAVAVAVEHLTSTGAGLVRKSKPIHVFPATNVSFFRRLGPNGSKPVLRAGRGPTLSSGTGFDGAAAAAILPEWSPRRGGGDRPEACICVGTTRPPGCSI